MKRVEVKLGLLLLVLLLLFGACSDAPTAGEPVDEERGTRLELIQEASSESLQVYSLKSLEEHVVRKAIWYDDDNAILAASTGSEDSQARLYNYNSKEATIQLIYEAAMNAGHNDRIARNQDYLVYESDDRALWFDAGSLAQVSSPFSMSEGTVGRFSPDLSYLVYFDSQGLHLLDLESKQSTTLDTATAAEDSHNGQYVGLTWNDSSTHVGFISNGYSTLNIVNVQTLAKTAYTVGKDIPTPEGLVDLAGLYFIPDGRGVMLEALCEEGSYYLIIDYSAENQANKSWISFGGGAHICDLQETQALLVIDKRQLIIYDFNSGQKQQLYSSEIPVVTASISNDGKRVIFTTYDFAAGEQLLHVAAFK